MQSKRRRLMPSKIFVSVTEQTLKNIVRRQSIGPFAACHSRSTKPPCWRAKVALGQDKQRKLPFKIMGAFCLTCPSGLQHGGFVPREWLAAKGLLSVTCSQYNLDNLKNLISYTNQKVGSAHPKIINSFLCAFGFDLIPSFYLRSVHLYCMQSVPIWQPWMRHQEFLPVLTIQGVTLRTWNAAGKL